MYSPRVTQNQIERVESKLTAQSGTKFELVRYDVGKVLEMVPHLARVHSGGPNGKPLRPFTREEQSFIRNEQILSKLDFGYFAARYSQIMLGGINQTGMGTLQMWRSQELLLEVIGKCEELGWEAYFRNEPVDGILICLNKSRQLGATAISRSIIMHRVCLWDHTQSFGASVDDDKVLELYTRDKRIYDNLPFYLKPSDDPRDGSIDKQANYICYGKLDSHILYQTSNQKSGFGQGRKFDVSHITECASFDTDGNGFGAIEHDFLPTLPQSPWVFCLLESTPQGRGNGWHTWSELVRKGRMARWKYLFVPVYVELQKYRRTPPANWVPAPLTLARAQKVEDTSTRIIGYRFIPDRDHLYWWETTRQEYVERGRLNIFLTNFADTPEESFQFSTGAALHPELIESLRTDNVEPVSYEFERSIR